VLAALSAPRALLLFFLSHFLSHRNFAHPDEKSGRAEANPQNKKLRQKKQPQAIFT